MSLFLKQLRNLLAVAILLTIPAFAICAMTTRGTPNSANVTLADNDDPIRNGLAVVHRSVPIQAKIESAFDIIPEAVLLIDWVFTGKGQPSPYG
jgi:hypothetical protein